MQEVVRIDGLPENALDAAAAFHARHLPAIRALLERVQVLAIVFAPAPYDHRGWRLAVVQDLARAHAPRRVNAVAGADETEISGALAYLAQAPGITGQLLGLQDHGKSGHEVPYVKNGC